MDSPLFFFFKSCMVKGRGIFKIYHIGWLFLFEFLVNKLRQGIFSSDSNMDPLNLYPNNICCPLQCILMTLIAHNPHSAPELLMLLSHAWFISIKGGN